MSSEACPWIGWGLVQAVHLFFMCVGEYVIKFDKRTKTCSHFRLKFKYEEKDKHDFRQFYSVILDSVK